MSNYYLCDLCAKRIQLWEWANEVDCEDELKTAKTMYDHHGQGGRRYDEPTDVCPDYERKEDA